MVRYPLRKGVVIIRKVDLNMDEQRKYEVIKQLVEKNGNKDRAAMSLSITRRQINRLIKVYCEKGKAGFVHGNRGRKPVTAIPENIKQDVIDLYCSKYYDANFAHFTELLERIEGIHLSASTVMTILEDASILSPRATRAKKKRVKKELLEKQKTAKTKKEAAEIQANLVAIEDAHSRRPRCAYFGEMEQMDASPFVWFGNSVTHLHIAIDDATGMLTGMWFDTQETLNGYYHVFHQILTRHGIPYKFFTDRRTVFTYKRKANASIEEDTCTQFAYACQQLGVELEFSSIPQAKGRVERAFETLQSRLPIEMRLAGVTDIDSANEFLNSYINEFNAKFALSTDGIKSVFEKQPVKKKINLMLAVLTQRTVDAGHCVQFKNKYYRMLNARGTQIHYLKGTKVMVIQAFDGCLYCCVNDKYVYALEEVPVSAKVSKNLDADYKQPKPKRRHIPPMNHPWRSQKFWRFVKAQEHHMMDDIPT